MNTNQTAENAFKLSQLRELENMDNEDLLLVSDYEGGKCYTRKMQVGRFLTELSRRMKTDANLKAAIDQTVAAALEDPSTTVSQNVEAKVEEAIEEMVLNASAED